MGTSYNPKIVTDGLVLNLDPANVKSYPAKEDPFVNNVSLMLAMDGANNSTTFTDSSQNALAATRFGTPVISTTQSKFGGSSAYFNGTSDYITYSSATLFDFSGDFTIEGFWYFSQINQNQGFTILFCGIELDRIQLATVSGGIELYWGGLLISYSIASSSFLNTWTHVAVTRSGTAVKLWINGVNVASATKATAIDVSGLSLAKQLNNGIYNGYFNGYIDEFRVTKGICRYTSTFTPPTQPLSLPGVVTDLTKNKISSTLTNTTFTSSNGGLLTYNGSSSTTVGSSAITGVSEFTVMVWFNSSSIVNYKNVLDFNYNFNGAGSSNTGPRLEMNSAGNLLWVFSGSSTNSATVNSYIAAKSSSLQTNTWYCAVVTRDNSLNVKAYLNGLDSGNSVIQAGSNNSAFIGSFNKITTGVGCYPYSDRYLSGYVSIILAYNRALTAAEVLQNYNATKGRFGL